MTPDRAIETAADYADALTVSRTAKNVLVLILLLLLLAQITLFFLVRFEAVNLDRPGGVVPTTQPSTDWRQLLHYTIGITAFLGVTLSVVLCLVLLLIVNIMLVGRLVGAGGVTSAYIWSLLLLVMLFPWQAFLNHVGLTPDQATFKIPGVLYTFYELADPEVGARFTTGAIPIAILKWSRFVVFPLVAVIMLLGIQIKSGRGLRQALGEEDLARPGTSM